MKLDETLNKILVAAYSEAKMGKHKYITPEHILYSVLGFEHGKRFMSDCGVNSKELTEDLREFLETEIEGNYEEEPIQTYGTNEMFNAAATQVIASAREVIELKDVIVAIYDLEESYASYFIKKQGIERLDILRTNTKTEKIQKEKEDIKEIKNKSINDYAVCLNDKYKEGKISKIIGREEEIKRTVQILLRKRKNNPIHVGEAGVGKTSIVHGIVQKIEEGEINESLKNGKIFSLDMGAILAGTKYRGDFEERFKNLLNEIAKYDNPIVYIDEIHTIIGAGAISGGTMDASNMLSSYLEEGHIKFIGSTTYAEYNKYIAKNSMLYRRFQKIDVVEPSKDETVKIVNGVKKEYENFHNVEYSNEAIANIIELSERYIRDKKFPDKAIDLMDEIGSYIKMEKLDEQISITIQDEIEENESVIKDYTFTELKEDVPKTNERVLIHGTDAKRVISRMLGIPQESVGKSNLDKLKSLKSDLQSKIFGQNKAIETTVEAIKRSYAGLNDDNKAVGNLLFVGPTGVGKTELAKQISKLMDMQFLRFDMSEYQEKHSVARLIGAPPGYVGYEEGGLLTDKVKNSPRSVVLLDEIEKAHSDIFNILLQVMDYGTLTDSSGSETDFRNTIIIMTSNAGAKDMGKDRIGFGERTMVNDAVNDELNKRFSPEFLNRLDDVIIFNHLGENEVKSIINKIFHEINLKLVKKGKKIEIGNEGIEYIIKNAYSKKYGAREIYRYIDKNVKSLLVDKILFDEDEQEVINITVEDGKLSI
ncbi:AAA family ATPase [Oceanirhabdus sp. W0125-5]|uniref:AAA family ATPase n=1 Tax=Oceanirhabdus sp. W0125-5 TaxID=2999116 RepID=UPI0022F32583|nr:AAA family ATPase [Oceanirhabdus sp. W0125-5]WBW99316.1 AAA family ATPase [Oceanirhabdus sp. W0125-5]